jgi:hypothetical protein
VDHWSWPAAPALLVFFDSFGDHPLPTGVIGDYTGVMKSCFASRVDEGTIRLRCRAEGPDGLIGDIVRDVHTDDSDWEKAVELLRLIQVRRDASALLEEIPLAELAQYRDEHLTGEVRVNGVWQSIEKVYPSVI